MGVKNPFGVRDGKIITVEDLSEKEKGFGCECFCPSCGGKFQARLGDKRTHHFAHDKDGCDEEKMFLNGMYMLIKQYIDSNEITIPALVFYWAYSWEPYTSQNFFERIDFKKSSEFYNTQEVYSETTIKFDSSEIIYNDDSPIAILLNYKDSKLALRIKPPDTMCRKFNVKKFEDIATIYLDASNIDFVKLNSADILAKVFESEIERWGWLYSEKALVKIDTINAKNNNWKKRIQKNKNEFDDNKSIKQKNKSKSERIPMFLNQHDETQTYEVKNKPRPQIDYSEQKFISGYNEVTRKDFSCYNEITDIYGHRWLECKICGEKNYVEKFSREGRSNKDSFGVCLKCFNN